MRTVPRCMTSSTLALFVLAGLTACSYNNDGDSPGAIGTTGTSGTAAKRALDPASFVTGALSEDVTTVDCTLRGGTETTCYRVVIPGVPAGAAVGPFCPETITTDAADSGTWLDGSGTVYDTDGDFIVDLPNIYDDPNWQLYDVTTGKVNVTDTQEACEAAARPDVDPAYRNHCVECSLDYVDGGVPQTLLIPTVPVPAAAAGNIGTYVGVSLNGSVLAAPAPVRDILSNYTIAVFDDCGGHVNPHDGYHYHAATGCTEAATGDDGHAGLLAYALDGYGIYGMLDADGNEAPRLDECRGVSDEVRGYHYYAASPGENMFIGCYHGESGSVEGDEGVGPGGPPPVGE